MQQLFAIVIASVIISVMLTWTAKGLFLEPNSGRISGWNRWLKLFLVYFSCGVVVLATYLLNTVFSGIYTNIVMGISVVLAIFVPVTFIFGTEAKRKNRCTQKLSRIQASPRLAAISTVLAALSLGLAIAK